MQNWTINRTLDQAITSTLNSLSSTGDIDRAVTRLQVISEIADGLGSDIDIPNRRKVLMEVYRREITEYFRR